jgi:hypothetical protein
MSASPITSTTVKCRYLVLAGLLIAVAATADASAAPPTSATCTGLITVSLSPGFTPTAGVGTGTSGGQTGKMVCLGTLDGHQITGPGTFSAEENYTSGAACLTDTSNGQVSATFPTTDGPISITGALQARRVGLVESIGIQFPGSQFGGGAIDVPTDGNCLIGPLTRVLVSVTGTLAG